MAEFQLVDQQSALEEAGRALAGASRLFVDTEFESNREGTRMCLLQVRASEGKTYLVDTVKLGSLDPLRPAFGAPGTEWVLHAGAQDVNLIVDRLRIPVPKVLFDTQIAWALLGPEGSVSLAYLCFRLLGLRSSKAHQADDWVRRPLGRSQLEYAASDVAHLGELRDILGERAKTLGREGILVAASSEALSPVREPPPPLSLESFRNAWQLEAPQQAALRYIIDWYNQLSREDKERAPETKALLSIASRMPESAEALGRIKGVPRGFAERKGAPFVSGMLSAADAAKAEDFVPIDPPPYATFEEIRLDAWLSLARAEVCARLEAAPEVALPSRVLKNMQRAAQDGGNGEAAVLALTGWRKELMAEAFVEFCKEKPAPL